MGRKPVGIRRPGFQKSGLNNIINVSGGYGWIIYIKHFVAGGVDNPVAVVSRGDVAVVIHIRVRTWIGIIVRYNPEPVTRIVNVIIWSIARIIGWAVKGVCPEGFDSGDVWLYGL